MGSKRLESCLRIAVAIEAILVACMDAAGTMSSFLFIYSLYRKEGSGVPDFWNYWGKEWISVLASVLFFFVVAYLGWRRSRRFPLFAIVSFAWVIEDVLALPHYIAQQLGPGPKVSVFFHSSFTFWWAKSFAEAFLAGTSVAYVGLRIVWWWRIRKGKASEAAMQPSSTDSPVTHASQSDR